MYTSEGDHTQPSVNTFRQSIMSVTVFTISPEMQSAWDDLMGQMCAFVNDTNADVDMAHDWVCEMLDVDSFVDNEAAWDSFYSAWESCDNRNTMEYVID